MPEVNSQRVVIKEMQESWNFYFNQSALFGALESGIHNLESRNTYAFFF